MSKARISLQNLAVRLVISPPPTTLGESTAVLKKLQSFGQVISFNPSTIHEMRQVHPPPENDQSEVEVVFASRKTIETARAAGPFTVRVNHDLPDPVVEDPYNVRFLQTRKQPSPKTMTCRLEVQGKDRLSGQNILSKGFSPSIYTRLHQSLTELNPPPGIAAGLSVFHTDSSNLLPTPDLVDQVPILMDMYRSQPTEPAGFDEASDKSPVDRSSTTYQ